MIGILESARRNLRLVALWMIAQPLARVMISAFVLAELLAARVPNVSGQIAYAMYLVAWMLCRSLFADDRTHSLTAKGDA